MALGTNQVTTSVANNFIPELQPDEVIGANKSNLVVANLVTKLTHKGQTGDKNYIPVDASARAMADAANNQVHKQDDNNHTVKHSMDKNTEYDKITENT